MNHKEVSQNATHRLIIGFAGVFLSILGDMLLMTFNTEGAEGILGSFLSAAQQTTYTRIGLAAFFGFIGIQISGMGFLALDDALIAITARNTAARSLHISSATAILMLTEICLGSFLNGIRHWGQAEAAAIFICI